MRTGSPFSRMLFLTAARDGRASTTEVLERMLDTILYAAHGESEIPFGADCPSRPILDQIADKWSMMTLAVLEKPTRFNEIKRRLDGVTQRVLTQTLRRLERNGMVSRQVLPTAPIGVEYSLTPVGASLRAPFGQLYDWTIEHADAIREAEVNYDEANEERK